ncbi:SDR family NAD(P)-dependent oxidoreductase [Paraburkholderia sp. BCC1885]|uniref:SDR family NAD(P)-dependent oxidoreductase n=1 Tax=Paraburkholderia sp. BCC1885 TaxID=2562669 RepID=UPI0011834683|nr:SDR family oxidoreductase [Paraburkholderia sp. BCC1885]
MRPLSGKTALVTGASRGIGRASALALAKAGAQVLVHYCREDQAAAEVVAQIRAAGGHAEKVAADLRAPEGPHRLARRVRVVIGARLDVLVASAGIAKDASIEDTTLADFDELVALNVRAPYFLVQQLMPVMCKGSSVVLVSSLAAHASVNSLSAYAATKGAIDTLVKHFAHTLGHRGVRVNAIAPGVVTTGMSYLATTEQGRAATLEMQALKRIAHAEEIGDTVAFLASDAARWVTGETLYVDGGSKL